MEKMVAMVMAYVDDGAIHKLEIDSSGIRRTKDHHLVTRMLKKTLRVTANKRRLGDRYMTYPYGYSAE
jgi:hypothetical protein